jgi:CRISPR-associated protein Cas1
MDVDENPVANRSCAPSTATGSSGASPPGAADPGPSDLDPPAAPDEPDEPPLRVMALHALLYCPRLFYLEEVEEIRVADAAVYAGRRLHDDVVPLDDETPERRSVELASRLWGIYGKADAVRRRDGRWVAIEHKRGRCRRDEDKRPQAWPSDRVQAVAYAVLLEEALGQPVPQARVRYHADNTTVLVEIDDAARDELASVIQQARRLRRTVARPPVAENQNLCPRCSLAPICLPEEERLKDAGGSPPAPRLFPANRERQTLHVVARGARVGRSGNALKVVTDEGEQKVPIEQVDSLLIHGFGQVTTQAIQMCARHGVGVEWLTAGGRFVAGTSASPGRVQQRIRQYQALTDPALRLRLARRLVHAKVETQLRYLLRATRGNAAARQGCQPHIDRIRQSLKKTADAGSTDSLLGLEGMAAKAYFAALPSLFGPQVPKELLPSGRSRRPPRDRFNCLLSFGYALIHSLVHRSLLAVGLEPAFGFYHQPRSAAPPLVLDLMELFRTPLWEMPLVGSINRGQWCGSDDFQVARQHVWLSDAGRKKVIELFETRLEQSHKHPYTGQSLTYARMVELEVRLLEKEWTGCPNVFAQLRLR